MIINREYTKYQLSVFIALLQKLSLYGGMIIKMLVVFRIIIVLILNAYGSLFFDSLISCLH